MIFKKEVDKYDMDCSIIGLFVSVWSGFNKEREWYLPIRRNNVVYVEFNNAG